MAEKLLPVKHSETQFPCPSCRVKLDQAIPFMRDWFYRVLLEFPHIHVSWSYRDMLAQNKMLADGKSKLKYSFSKHNKTDAQGNPQSWALDLFEQVNGVGKYDPITYVKINERNIKNNEPIFWGGNWKALGDRDHFEWDPNHFNEEKLSA